MTIELLKTLSLISFIAAALFLLITVALFFMLDIPKIYGEISGKTARKAIEAINNRNKADSGVKKKSKHTEKKLTDKITSSGRLVPATGSLEFQSITEKFPTETLAPPQTSAMQQVNAYEIPAFAKTGETTVIGNATQSAVSGATTVLSQYSAETISNEISGNTTVLQNYQPPVSQQTFAETTLLVRNKTPVQAVQPAQPAVVTVDVEISFTGSEEIIV